MELDEIRAAWADQDRKIEENIRLNRRVLGLLQTGRARPALQRFIFAQMGGAAVWLAIAGISGSFIYHQAGTARFPLMAAVLDLYAIGNIVARIRQTVAAFAIDYTQPVAEIQKKLETLRIAQIRYTQAAILTGLLLWTPFAIVLLKVTADVDAYRSFGTAWIVSNFAFSVAACGCTLWLSRWTAARHGGSSFVGRIANDLAGYNLNAAAQALSSLAEFERED
jgi:serine/threonine-protein kinase